MTEAGVIDEYPALVDLESVLVFDPVTDETRAALKQWGASYYQPVSGF